MGLPTGDDDLQGSDSSDAEREKTAKVQGKATFATTSTSERATDTWGTVQFGRWQGGGWEDDGAEVEDATADGREARKDGGDDDTVSTSMGGNILDGILVGGGKEAELGGEGGGINGHFQAKGRTLDSR